MSTSQNSNDDNHPDPSYDAAQPPSEPDRGGDADRHAGLPDAAGLQGSPPDPDPVSDGAAGNAIDLPEALLHAELLSPGVQLTANTRRRRATAIATFVRFCRHLGVDPVSASPYEFALYITDRVLAGLSKGTVAGDISAVTAWRGELAADHSTLAGFDAPARAVLAGAAKTGAFPDTVQATVYPYWFLLDMAGLADPDAPSAAVYRGAQDAWRSARDRAMVAVGYAAALRADEVCTIDLANVTRHADRYVFLLVVSKSNQAHARTETFELHPTGDALCPVTALDTWLEHRGDRPGALFIGYRRRVAPVCYHTWQARLNKLAYAAGEQPATITSHSLRRSWATHAALAGTPIRDIRDHLRHADEVTTERYIGASSPLVRPADAAAFFLEATRPQDPSFVFSTATRAGQGQRYTPVRSRDELEQHAAKLARAGSRRYASSTVATADRTYRRFSAWCAAHGKTPDVTSDALVATYLAARHASRVHARSITTEFHMLAAWRRINEPLKTSDDTMSRRVLEGIRRSSDPRPPTHAPVISPSDVSRLAAAAFTFDDTALATVVLSYHAANAATWTLAPPTSTDTLPATPASLLATLPAEVSFDTDGATAAVRLACPGEPALEARFAADRDDPTRCPVRALAVLARRGANRPLVDPATAGLRHTPDTAAAFTPEQFTAAVHEAAWRLRAAHRDRMVVLTMYGAALYPGEIRAAHIEDLEEIPGGFRLHSHVTVDGPSMAAPVLIEATGDELCPVAAIEDWLDVWPFTTGPLVPGTCNPARWPASGPPRGITHTGLEKALSIAAAEAHVELSTLSLRRSRISHAFAQGRELLAARRLARHRGRGWAYTARFLSLADPSATSPTRNLAAGHGPHGTGDDPTTAEQDDTEAGR